MIFYCVQRYSYLMCNTFGVFLVLVVVFFTSGELFPVHIRDGIHYKVQMRLVTTVDSVQDLIPVPVVQREMSS